MEELHRFPSFGVGVGAQRHNITQIGRAAKVPVLNPFQEYVSRIGVEYEYIGYSVTGQQVATRILSNFEYK